MSPVMRIKFIRIVIAFVNDADFYIESDFILTRARELIIKYNKLHEESEGKGQLEKNNFYLWKTK